VSFLSIKLLTKLHVLTGVPIQKFSFSTFVRGGI